MNHLEDLKWKDVENVADIKRIFRQISTKNPFYVTAFQHIIDSTPTGVENNEIDLCIDVVTRWKTSIETSSLRDILTQNSTIHWEHFCNEIIKFGQQARIAPQSQKREKVEKFQKILKWKISLLETSNDILGSGAFSVVKAIPMLGAARKSFVFDKHSIKNVKTKELSLLQSTATVIDNSALTLAIHMKVLSLQKLIPNNLDGVCRILGFKKSYVTPKSKTPHTHFKLIKTPNEQKVYIYMETLHDFDNTVDILDEENREDDSIVDNFLIYCIYKTFHSQVQLYKLGGIVHCDMKSDNVMLRKQENSESLPTSITVTSLDGKHNKTFTFSDDTKIYSPTIIDLDCSIIWKDSNVILGKDDYSAYSLWKKGIQTDTHTKRSVVYYFPFYSPIFSIEKYVLNCLLFTEGSYMFRAREVDSFICEFIPIINRFLSFYGSLEVSEDMFRCKKEYPRLWSVLEKTKYFSPSMRGIRATVDYNGMVSAHEDGSELQEGDCIIRVDDFVFEEGIFTTYVKNGITTIPTKSKITYIDDKNEVRTCITQIKQDALLWAIRPTIPDNTKWRSCDWQKTMDFILYGDHATHDSSSS